jgi:serine/threonine-protein kinase HipA
MNREIFVYADLNGESHLVGTLWTRQGKSRESASFEYDPSWLCNPKQFALEPALQLSAGTMHTDNQALFGAIGDSAPDRWGRILIQREERRKARQEDRTSRTLSEADYLLGVGDITRQGALRFTTEKGGAFLAPQDQTNIPPLIRLGELLGAATRVLSDEDNDSDLRLLLAPGSSLGGARAKASVIDNDGTLSIAKFPQADDTWSVTLWEAVALDLATRAGIPTPAHRIEKVSNRNVLILKRFDRSGQIRIPFLSATPEMHAQNQTHMNRHLRALARTRSHPCMHALTRTRTYTHPHPHTDAHTHTRTHSRAHTHSHARKRTRAQTHARTHTDVRTHTHL